MARCADVSWGSGFPAVLLDLGAGSEVDWGSGEVPGILRCGCSQDAEALVERFGGKCYYTSRSGCSGAVTLYLPPSVVEVGVIRIDTFYSECSENRKVLGMNVAVPLWDYSVPFDGYAVVENVAGTSSPVIVPTQELLRFLRGELDDSVVEFEWRERLIPTTGEDLQEKVFHFLLASASKNLKWARREPHFKRMVRALTIEQCRFQWDNDTVEVAARRNGHPENRNPFWGCMGVVPATDGWSYVLRGGICRRKLPTQELLSSVETLEKAMPARGQAVIASGSEAMYLLVEDEERPHFSGDEPEVGTAVYLLIDEEGIQWDYESRCTAEDLLAVYAGKFETVLERCRAGAENKRARDLAWKREYLVRKEHEEAFGKAVLELIETRGDTVISTEDSVAAGNCQPGTEDFRDRTFPGRDSVTIRELAPYAQLNDVMRVIRHKLADEIEQIRKDLLGSTAVAVEEQTDDPLVAPFEESDPR